MFFYSILSLIHALACCYFLVIHSKTYCLFCAYQVTHLFDNGGTVFFAIFMAIWGESESFYFNHCSFHQQKDRQVSMWFKNKLSNIKEASFSMQNKNLQPSLVCYRNDKKPKRSSCNQLPLCPTLQQIIQSCHSRPHLKPKYLNISILLKLQFTPLNTSSDKQTSVEGSLVAITGELVLDNCGHIIQCN